MVVPVSTSTGTITVVCPPSVIVETIEICAGDSTEWNGVFYSESGQYTYENIADTCSTLEILRLRIFGENLEIACDPWLCGPDDTMDLTALNVNGTFLWSTGETTRTITIDSAGFYRVTVTSADGCVSNKTAFIVERSLPEAVISGATEMCPGDEIPLSVTETEGATYVWSTGDTTAQILATSPGDYTVTVTDAFGCSAVSDVFELTQRPYVSYEIILGASLVCLDETTSVIIGGIDIEVVWFDGSDLSVRDLGVGEHIVTIIPRAPGLCPVDTIVVIEEDRSYEFICPANVTVYANPIDSFVTAPAIWEIPEPVVNCLLPLTVEGLYAPGSSFPVGETINEYTVTDTETGATTSCQHTITVIEMGPGEIYPDTTVLDDNGIFCTLYGVNGLEAALTGLQASLMIDADLELLTVVRSDYLLVNYPGTTLEWRYDAETSALKIIILGEDGSAIAVPDGTELFVVKTRPLMPAEPGDCYDIELHPDFLPEVVLDNGLVFPPSVFSAELCVPREFIIHGIVRRPFLEFNGDPVVGAVVHLLQGIDTVATQVTGENGEFDFGLQPGGFSYRIEVKKDDNHDAFLSVLDLVAQLDNLLLNTPYTSIYQFEASDCEKNYLQTLLDLERNRAVQLGRLDRFPESSSWTFDHAGGTVAYAFGDQLNEAYVIDELNGDTELLVIGIKTGDLLESAAGSGLQAPGHVELSLMDQTYTAGDEISVAVDMGGAPGVSLPTAFSDNLVFIGVEPFKTDEMGMVDAELVADGLKLIYLTDGNANKAAGEQGFIMRFRALNAGRLSEDLQIDRDHEVKPAELVTRTMEVLNPVFVFGETSIPEIGESVTAYPNPFTETVTMQVEVAAEVTYTLRVLDATGRIVMNGTEMRGPGTLELDLGGRSPGVYTVLVITADGATMTERLVKQ